ncbi:hypothetical protein O181_022197 [Austropuccinia psidii MF-1]|uniref:BRCT domain-containing protein n=1 Tax=Austropuccinia psidii MF-1 TaxID=1389203 RepID=A0A9Q3CF09_9BASI|nr:hypothetical protein [Austropuccinia psidii MF-1]
MDKFLIRKRKEAPQRDDEDISNRKEKQNKSVSTTALTSALLKSSQLPQVPFLSSAVSRVNNILNTTLSDPSNPITHSSGYRRAQHVVSSSKGHQQSNGRSGPSAHYNSTRLSKLRAQAKQAETDILKNVVIYINGYTGTEVTNQALIGMIHSAGGQTRPILSAICTHIVTAMPLSAKKSQIELERKRIGPKIVRPEWVLDSIKLGKRQAEWKYPIQELHTQASISSVFGSTNAKLDTS